MASSDCTQSSAVAADADVTGRQSDVAGTSSSNTVAVVVGVVVPVLVVAFVIIIVVYLYRKHRNSRKYSVL